MFKKYGYEYALGWRGFDGEALSPEGSFRFFLRGSVPRGKFSLFLEALSPWDRRIRSVPMGKFPLFLGCSVPRGKFSFF